MSTEAPAPQAPTEAPSGPIEITADPITLKVLCREMVKALRAGPQSRARSVAITKLEEARMWLDEAQATD